ncbi:MAG: serine/threonine protein kinase [Deltaproteobacteria bacterium]|nr:serine/threonine protein kinase [Deltaproteobacteria bacterium]
MEPKPFGRYVLLEKLAVGGMAEIYKAKTYGVDGFEKLLAIKRILPHCAADKEFINMLVDEAKLTVLLSHANIVQVYDLGKVGDDYFISMEYINGTNMREMMIRTSKAGEGIAEDLAVYIVSEMCKGLDYAHRKTNNDGSPLNIVHRDISPQNILISYEGEVKIVDFGIAKAALNVSHTMAGILKGKIAYMSPEQALGKPIDNRTDIFSAGVVLYELLTGEKLYQGETQFEVLRKIRSTRVNTTALPDSIPGPLKGILVKALAYQAKDRYQTAGDFQLDLTKYLYSSHTDFSPRHLASLVQKYFAQELKERKRDQSPAALDEKTRSVIIREAAKEEIVVKREDSEPEIESTQGAILKEAGTAATSPSLTRKKSKIVPIGISLFVAIGLAIGGVVLFKKTGVKPKTGEPVTQQAPATRTTPPAETGLGTLQIVTDPPGALVFLNNNPTNLVTPAILKNLYVGENYHIKVTREKYRDMEKQVTVNSEQPILVEGKLQPLPLGVVEIVSNPSGAKILLNGQELGRETPARVENLELNKPYTLKLVKDQFSEWNSPVEIKGFDPVRLEAALIPLPKPATPTPIPPVPATPKGDSPKPQAPPQATIKKELKPPPPPPPVVQEKKVEPPPPAAEEKPSGPFKYASLNLKSEPSGAEVYVNGEFKGNTPLKVSDITPGSVKLTVSKEGLMKYNTQIRLESGESKSLGTIQLGSMYGEVSISSDPPRANVIFDGEQIGPKTPVTIKKVPRDRPHSVRLQLGGYRGWESTFDLKDDPGKKYNVTLERE